MTVNIELNDLVNLQNENTAITQINQNSESIESGFGSSLNSQGDRMLGTLDMNSNQLINLPAPASANSPVRLQDVTANTLALTVLSQAISVNVMNFMSSAQVSDVKARTYTLDTSSSIQAAINSLPAAGGSVYFPVGGYRVQSTLTVGNGTSGGASTIHGVRLVGDGGGWGINGIAGTPSYLPTDLKLYGSTHSGMIVKINGPIIGAGVSNMSFSFNSDVGTNAVGIYDLGCSYGEFSNIAVLNPSNFGIVETTNGLFGGEYNIWRNLYIYLQTGGNTQSTAVGLLNGANAASGGVDRAYDSFDNLNIVMNNTSQTAIELQYCDSILFRNVLINPAGATGLLFNYVPATSIGQPGPTGCTLFGFDARDNGVGNAGTPTAGLNNPNYIFYPEFNSGSPLPTAVNLITVNGLLNGSTVTALSPSVTGAVAMVTDATATSFGSVVTGGGSNIVPVYYTGAAWRIG